MQAVDFSGLYHLENVREVGSELALKPDGKFDFMLAYGAADYFATGTWKAQNGSVILNSTSQEDHPPFQLKQSSTTKAAAIRVRVMGQNGKGVANIDVMLVTKDNHFEARTDSDGIAMFQKRGAPTGVAFRVRVYSVETEPYAVNSAHDDFTFEINGTAIREVRFTEEHLTVQGKALICHHWGADHEMVYEKEQ